MLRAAPPFVALLCLSACASLGPVPRVLEGPPRQRVQQQLSQARWGDALQMCQAVLKKNGDDCTARWCELIGQTMVFVDQLNTYLLPRFRNPGRPGLSDVWHVWQVKRQLGRIGQAADEVTARSCEIELPAVPLRLGDAEKPIIEGELRGQWTVRTAHSLGAIAYAFKYLLGNLFGQEKVPPAIKGDPVPPMPEDLRRMTEHLAGRDRRLFSHPADPAVPRGGWYPRAGQAQPSPQDELLIDIFRPGTQVRIFDFKGAEFVRGESMARGALVQTAALAAPRCGYQRWHIDTLFQGKHVANTDGMSFSPDGRRLVLPMKRDGRYQIHVLNADGTGARCLTCGQPGGNDGVRWQPGGDVLIFVSDRDHPHGVGDAGGGAGQELYSMHSDGSRLTRLTFSDVWATNYHVNWSMDGKRIVWGSTEQRTWDVMVADFIEDAAGARLLNPRRLTHDTTWWETHGFTPDGKAVITTNTRAGLMQADIYAIDIETRKVTRLTDSVAWDEHAHLSPDGRKMAWISGRWRRASVERLNGAGISPAFDFFWIVPGVMFEFINHPAGYATELTLMDADGQHIQRLTTDQEIVADNEWSPDGRRIIFRQVKPRLFGEGRIRILTFDDCH